MTSIRTVNDILHAREGEEANNNSMTNATNDEAGEMLRIRSIIAQLQEHCKNIHDDTEQLARSQSYTNREMQQQQRTTVVVPYFEATRVVEDFLGEVVSVLSGSKSKKSTTLMKKAEPESDLPIVQRDLLELLSLFAKNMTTLLVTKKQKCAATSGSVVTFAASPLSQSVNNPETPRAVVMSGGTTTSIGPPPALSKNSELEGSGSQPFTPWSSTTNATLLPINTQVAATTTSTSTVAVDAKSVSSGSSNPQVFYISQTPKAINGVRPSSFTGSVKLHRQLTLGEDEAGFETVNSYVVVQELGNGTTATVLQVCDTLTSQMFAIKRVRRGAGARLGGGGPFGSGLRPQRSSPSQSSLAPTPVHGVGSNLRRLPTAPAHPSMLTTQESDKFEDNLTPKNTATATTPLPEFVEFKPMNNSPSVPPLVPGSRMLHSQHPKPFSNDAGPATTHFSVDSADPQPPAAIQNQSFPPLAPPSSGVMQTPKHRREVSIANTNGSVGPRRMSSGMQLTPAQYNFRKEIAIMKKLKHPNLVKLHEVIDDGSDEHVYMVMDFVEGGPLLVLDPHQNQVTTPKEPYSLPVIRAQFKGLSNGLWYLHRHGIAHLDIKPENILLNADGDPIIVDFGVAHQKAMTPAASGQHGSPTKFGTPYFFSPEQCQGTPAEEMNLFAADVWALGVTLYTMLFRKLPFYAKSRFALNDTIINDDHAVPDDCPSDACNLLNAMLCKDPKKRIGIKEVCRHPFVKQIGAARPGQIRGGRRQSHFHAQSQQVVLEQALTAVNSRDPSQLSSASGGGKRFSVFSPSTGFSYATPLGGDMASVSQDGSAGHPSASAADSIGGGVFGGLSSKPTSTSGTNPHTTTTVFVPPTMRGGERSRDLPSPIENFADVLTKATPRGSQGVESTLPTPQDRRRSISCTRTVSIIDDTVGSDVLSLMGGPTPEPDHHEADVKLTLPDFATTKSSGDNNPLTTSAPPPNGLVVGGVGLVLKTPKAPQQDPQHFRRRSIPFVLVTKQSNNSIVAAAAVGAEKSSNPTSTSASTSGISPRDSIQAVVSTDFCNLEQLHQNALEAAEEDSEACGGIDVLEPTDLEIERALHVAGVHLGQ